MRVRLLGTVLLVVMLAACDSPTASIDGAPTPAEVSDLPQASTPPRASASPGVSTSPGVSASPGVSGPPATECGTFVLSQGKDLPDGVVGCFVDAVRARRPARLAVTTPTTEGDPVPVTYVADAGGRVEIVTDSRQDSFGARSVVRQECTGATSVRGRLQFTSCSPPTTVEDVQKPSRAPS